MPFKNNLRCYRWVWNFKLAIMVKIFKLILTFSINYKMLLLSLPKLKLHKFKNHLTYLFSKLHNQSICGNFA